MKTAMPHIKINFILTGLMFLVSLNVFSATYKNSYHSNNSEQANYTNTDKTSMLPSERTSNEMEGMYALAEDVVLLGDAEDPFDPGAGNEDPNAYNDVPIEDGLLISLLFALCYGMFLWFRNRKSTINKPRSACTGFFKYKMETWYFNMWLKPNLALSLLPSLKSDGKIQVNCKRNGLILPLPLGNGIRYDKNGFSHILNTAQVYQTKIL